MELTGIITAELLTELVSAIWAAPARGTSTTAGEQTPTGNPAHVHNPAGGQSGAVVPSGTAHTPLPGTPATIPPWPHAPAPPGAWAVMGDAQTDTAAAARTTFQPDVTLPPAEFSANAPAETTGTREPIKFLEPGGIMKGRFTIRPQPAEIKEPDLPGLKESAARLRSVPDQPADRPFLRQTAPDRNSWPQTWLALHGYDAKNMPPAGERRRGRQPGKHTPSCSMRVDIPSVGPVRLDVAIVLGGILRVSLASFSQTFVDELRRELAGLDDIAREMNLRLLLDLHVLEHEGTGHAIIG